MKLQATIAAFAALTMQSVSSQTVVDIAVGSPDHTTLVAALTSAGLVETLSGTGPFTVFAPINEAFETTDLNVTMLLEEEWKAHLQDLLLYHVLGAEVFSFDLVEGMMATTLQGGNITVSSLTPTVTINDVATVDPADINATNGVVHVIDELLVPGSLTNDIVDVAVAAGFSTLAALVTEAGLVETLQGPGPFTVFAPTNEAFADIGITPEPAKALEGEELVSVLTYHVVPGIYLSSELTDGQELTTVEGSTITISLNPAMANTANIGPADVLASNGVIHVVDEVLVMEEDEMGTPSPGPEETSASFRVASLPAMFVSFVLFAAGVMA